MPKTWSYNLHYDCQDTLWSLTKNTQCLSKFVIGEEVGQNLFFFWTIASFLKNLVLHFLDPTKKWPYRLHHTGWKTLSTLIYCSLTFSVFDKARKIGEVFSFLGKSVLFSKIVYFNNLLRPIKRSYYYHSISQNIFLALMNRFLRFVKLNNSKKYEANTILYWKDCLPSKNMCFEQPLRSQRKDLTTCTINAKIPCGA